MTTYDPATKAVFQEVTRNDVRWCCVIDCNKAAEFEIWGDFNHPEDTTDACEGHVGALLGTPDWAIKMYGREAGSWTVIPIPKED